MTAPGERPGEPTPAALAAAMDYLDRGPGSLRLSEIDSLADAFMAFAAAAVAAERERCARLIEGYADSLGTQHGYIPTLAALIRKEAP